MKDTNPSNAELRKLGTHQAAGEHMHETIERAEVIQPPVQPNPGPYDTRSGKFENHFAAGHEPEQQ